MRIKNLLELLSLDDYYGVSDNIDHAKGINKLPETWKEVKSILKRRALNKNTKWHKQK